MGQQLSYPAGVLLLVAAVAVCIGAAVQVLQYRRGSQIISRAQLFGRLAMAVILVAIIGFIFFGVLYDWTDPLTELMFWTGLMLLGFLVVFLALHDFRLLDKERHLGCRLRSTARSSNCRTRHRRGTTPSMPPGCEPADEVYMRRTLELAARGLGRTRPNPAVGALVVAEGAVIGEGWHQRAGDPHAEPLALQAAGPKAKGATIYVTLEPCSHVGRTPPCTDAIIEAASPALSTPAPTVTPGRQAGPTTSSGRPASRSAAGA